MRHPDDPQPVRASKAVAVWWLGVLALVTGPLLGGVVPASVALVLAGQFWREAPASGGFLTGGVLVRRGEWLAWCGIALAMMVLVAAIVVGVFQAAQAPPSPRFPPGVD